MTEIKTNELPKLEIGEKIKLYGKETTVTGFSASWSESLDRYEIILLTTGRGDPFERSLDVIEVLDKIKLKQNDRDKNK